ncbi:MAG: hypothetical protein J2P36_05420, partial [Ktedonobacteraceae bacterium]|nr:hypothetical protein [Ktedonobacteraceae bacterium]
HVTDEAQKMSVSTRVNVQQSASGSPRLRLSTTSSSFAADAPGVVSSKTISLINDGGGQVSWKAASDQQVWLAVSPTSGTFAGRQDVQLTVNRAALAAGSYTGHLTFSSDAGSSPLTLTVTMGVSTGSAAISVSTTSLDFAATTVQNPPDQFITLRNNSVQALDWNSSASTGDGSSWLLITPARGHLEAGASVDVQVSVLSQQLPAGIYQAAIDFGGGANARVLVNCMVQAAANLIASPTALSFALTAGKQTDSQSLTLRNNGDLDMSWSGSAATDDQGRWLTLNPPAGQLPAGAQATVKVTVAGSTLKPGMHHGMLTFSSSGIRSQVAISLSMIESMMSVPTTPLTFSSFVGKTPAARSLTLTNSGNAPLNWITLLSLLRLPWAVCPLAAGCH